MSGKLSERFHELKSTTATTGRIRNENRQNRNIVQKNQRANQVAQRRGTPQNNNNNRPTKRNNNNGDKRGNGTILLTSFKHQLFCH
jgi:hypothetical protein